MNNLRTMLFYKAFAWTFHSYQLSLTFTMKISRLAISFSMYGIFAHVQTTTVYSDKMYYFVIKSLDSPSFHVL